MFRRRHKVVTVECSACAEIRVIADAAQAIAERALALAENPQAILSREKAESAAEAAHRRGMFRAA